MYGRDELAKYLCDRIATTLKGYGRTVKRVGDHSLVVSVEPFAILYEWRLLVRRNGTIELEPLDAKAARRPVPNIVEHIRDALADEYDFSVGGDGSEPGTGVVTQLRPRALSNAPLALPAASEL